MYLHFEDWSSPHFVQEKLARTKLPNCERVIKVFASDEDPRAMLGKSALTVLETDGSAFLESETYKYQRRRTYSGQELEQDLAAYGLSDSGNNIVRSLFRFSNEQGFCQSAMSATRNRVWLIKHPLSSIDGLENAQKQPKREGAIHLDIFFPKSLEILKNVVDYDSEEAILNWQEGAHWLREQS